MKISNVDKIDDLFLCYCWRKSSDSSKNLL